MIASVGVKFSILLMSNAFIDDLFDFNEEVSVRQKLDIIM